MSVQSGRRVNNWRTVGIIAITVLMLLLIAYYMGWVGGEKILVVDLDTAQIRTVIARVSESGTIKPDIEVPVAPDVSGEVTALYVKEGDYVKKGQLLFVIRPDNFQAAVEQVTASLNSAKADYATTQARISEIKAALMQDSINLSRNRELFEQKAISLQEYENLKMRYAVAKAQLESANQTAQAAYFRIESTQANLKQARESLNRTSVFASMDGIITKLDVQLGQRVVGTGQMAGTEILKIADLTRMEVATDINENDIVKLHPGDSATIEVDAYPDIQFKGKVSEIGYFSKGSSLLGSNTGTSDQVTSYPVRVSIDPASYQNNPLFKNIPSSQSPFRPGMSAVVTIYTDKVEKVVTVPIQAVTIERPDREKKRPDLNSKKQEIVFILNGDKAKSVPVKTGLSDDYYIEIKSGLKAGEIIISGPYSIVTRQLANDMKVKPRPADEKSKFQIRNK